LLQAALCAQLSQLVHCQSLRRDSQEILAFEVEWQIFATIFLDWLYSSMIPVFSFTPFILSSSRNFLLTKASPSNCALHFCDRAALDPLVR